LFQSEKHLLNVNCTGIVSAKLSSLSIPHSSGIYYIIEFSISETQQ
jgi:amino acid transporter